MHVVHVTPAIFQRGARGGGERYFNEYVSALNRPGYMSELYSVPNLKSVNEVSLPAFETHSVSMRELYARMRAADIVHVHHLNTPGFDHALLAGMRGGPAIVLSDYGGALFSPARALGRLRNRRIGGFAAISKWSVGDVDSGRVIPHVSVIYGGGDHILRNPGRCDPRYETDFLFVGRLLPHKGAHIAIQALPQEARLVIAGETRDVEYYAELQRLAAGKNIEFIGSPDDDVLSTLYCSARFSVLPSVESYRSQKFTRPELLGLVVLEAMACGTPVIGSATGGLAEVLELAGQYSARAGDVAHWNTVMTQALAGPRLAPPALFTWDSVSNSTHELYARVADSTQ